MRISVHIAIVVLVCLVAGALLTITADDSYQLIALYAATVLAVWRWASLTLSRPLQRLCQAALHNTQTSEPFTIIEAGPKEIRDLTHAIGAFVTSTNQRQQQAEIDQQQSKDAAARMKAIMDTAVDGIFTTDEQGRIETFNNAAENIFCYTQKQVHGQDLEMLIPCPREQIATADAITDQTSSSIPRQMIGINSELLARRSDNSTFSAELSVSEVQTDDRSIFAWIIRDISRRKDSETQLQELNRQLVEASRAAGMAEIASGVLHNVGNVLNSINVSATCAKDRVSNSKLPGLVKIVNLLEEYKDDLANFISNDPKGQQLPKYLSMLAQTLDHEHEQSHEDLQRLVSHVEHANEIVGMQQAYAGSTGTIQEISPAEICDQALTMCTDSFEKYRIELVRDFRETPNIMCDKHKLLQIVVNLIRNAKDAVVEYDGTDRRIILTVKTSPKDHVQIQVRDSGTGIETENLTQIFQHGFTTKKDGHGFGLHSSANAATEIKGSLSAHSEGLGKGAWFILDIPVNRKDTTPCLSTLNA